jgi:anaerobic magnesium-protoporphyrin IX monomethyl ester cyclase
MRILLVNVPHLAIGSRMPNEHLPPLGLLSIGGPLIDLGHHLELLDAEFGPMPFRKIIRSIIKATPDLVMFGHSGSTSAQPIIDKVSQEIRALMPEVKIILGGVYPTYHWKEILMSQPQYDVIVKGEGEQVVQDVIKALENASPLQQVHGIAFLQDGAPTETQNAALIQNLDDYRVAWELMKGYNYTYWGKRKAVVVQFARGCPYPCTYCGQSLFWKKWRHRDPKKFAAELAWLHREHGVQVVNFADENPTTNRKVWIAFLQALIAENVKLILVGSCRADNIVRDADVLHLYKKAGFERFLLGIENYEESTLSIIKKAGTIQKDRDAILLLRKHHILSMATYVVGFEEEKWSDYLKGLKHLLSYDPDQIQMLYVTPHRWTPFFHAVKDKTIIQSDQRKWDYKHQVLHMKYMKPITVILWVKFIEVTMQMRPRSIWRVLFHPDARIRSAMRWYYNIGRKVWFYELFCFFFKEKHNQGLSLKEFWKYKEPSITSERESKIQIELAEVSILS